MQSFVLYYETKRPISCQALMHLFIARVQLVNEQYTAGKDNLYPKQYQKRVGSLF